MHKGEKLYDNIIQSMQWFEKEDETGNNINENQKYPFGISIDTMNNYKARFKVTQDEFTGRYLLQRRPGKKKNQTLII